MRTNLGKKSFFWPLPVVVVGSYDENGVADAMTAAYATLYDYNQIFVSMETSHKSYKNIHLNKAFTVAFATDTTMIEADYLGVVSANTHPNKVTQAHLPFEKAKFVNAPLFDDFPITCECKLVSDNDGFIVGEIVNISVDDKYIKDGKIDMNHLNFISFDPTNIEYRLNGKTIGKAHSIGKKLIKE